MFVRQYNLVCIFFTFFLVYFMKQCRKDDCNCMVFKSTGIFNIISVILSVANTPIHAMLSSDFFGKLHTIFYPIH